MSQRPNTKAIRQHQEKADLDLVRRNLEQAEVLLARENVGLPSESTLANLLLQNATRLLHNVTRTVETNDLELRIAQASRLRAAIDCRQRRDSFRVVGGGTA